MSLFQSGKINSHNEWDTLKEVIVGTSKGSTATLSWFKKEKLKQKIIEEANQLAKQACPDWFYDEVEEDLDNLANVIRKFGAVVHRPKVLDQKVFFGTPDWIANSNNAYNARDLNLVVGNYVIESPSFLPSRYYETTAFYDIWYEYFEKGFKWIAAPKPVLDYEALSPYFRDESERILTDEDLKHKELTNGRIEKLHKLSEKEILFEAANTLRLGKDLLFLLSSSGNLKAANWLKSILEPEYNIHITSEIYRSSHIDSTLLALRPGLIMVNDKRVGPKNCPKIFDKWDKIYFGDVAPTSENELKFQKEIRDPIGKKLFALGFNSNLHDMSSPWVGMNFLSLDPSTVIVDERQKSLINLLEKLKFTVIPIRMRHIYTQGGGIHCATLDTVRESKLESYFD